MDIVLFINGTAIATVELEHPRTNQTVYHAREQYKIVAYASRSADLKTAPETEKRIVITIVQKFPFIVEGKVKG